MKYKIIIIAILILLGNQKIFSQSYNFKGSIIDYESNSPIPGATIIDGNNSKNGTISDKDGNFEIKVEGDIRKLELYFVGCYPIKFINIPLKNKHIDLEDIKMAPNHLMDNIVVGGPPSGLYDIDKQQEQDKRLRKNVLEKYRIKVLKKKLKPYFDGKYIVFDFNNNEKK